MGSFLMSCGLTNQAIQEYEEVYVIPVVRIPGYAKVQLENGDVVTPDEHPVHATDVYTPVGVIFPAVYADYGKYEVDWECKTNSNMLDAFHRYLQKQSKAVLEGENKFHEIPVDFSGPKPKNKDLWDRIQNAVWENRLVVQLQYRKAYSNVVFFVVHKNHADKLVELGSKQRRKEFKNYSGRKKYAASPLEKFKKYFEPMRKKQQRITEIETRQSNGERISDSDIALVLKTKFRDIVEDAFFFFCGHCTDVASLISPCSTAHSLFKISDVEERKEGFLAYTFLQDLMIFMSSTNVHPTPVRYAGQDYGNKAGNLFIELMKNVNKYNKEQAKKYY